MEKTRISTRLLANFFGKGWTALLGLIATPIYVHLLSMESYGLIGFYMTLVTLFYSCDFGLGDTLCRELARLSSYPDQEGSELRTTLRTLELIYWGFGAVLATTLYFLSPFIAVHWFYEQTSFSTDRLVFILRLMSLSFFFQWPFLFYCKGLQGLQKHFTLNAILFISSSIRYLGAIMLLLLFIPSVELFFYWQIVCTCMQTLLALYLIWKKLSFIQTKALFSLNALKRVWKFSAGMTAIGITTVMLLQADKIVVSHLFNLESLGYYCLASSVSSSLYLILQPILSVYYPIFVQSIESKNRALLKSSYQNAAQLVILTTGSCALFLIFFSKQLLYLWTSNMEIAAQAAPIVSLLTLGILLNCCMNIPYILQIAYGWTRLTLYQNIVSALLLAPALLALAKGFGLLGASAFYILLNLGYIIIVVPIVHKKVLHSEKKEWFRNALMIPLLAGTLPALIGRRLLQDIEGAFLNVFVLMGSFCAIMICMACFTPLTKNKLWLWSSKLRT